MPLNILYFR